jgi:hypothetical protein
VQYYDGYETFTPPNTDNAVDAAEYPWRQLGGFVAFSGLESIQNRGPEQAIDIVEARLKKLEANLKNQFATSLFSDGTGSGGKEFGGFRLFIQDNPAAAGTVGGINQVTNAFWRNQVSASAAFNTSNALSRMNTLYLACIRGGEAPDLIVADAEMFGQYEATQQQLQRFTSEKMAAAGFLSYRYKGADVVYDDSCPQRRMYFLTTSSFAFRYARDRWFSVGDTRTVTNADYEVTPIWVAGNLTCNNRALNGVIISSGLV